MDQQKPETPYTLSYRARRQMEMLEGTMRSPFDLPIAFLYERETIFLLAAAQSQQKRSLYHMADYRPRWQTSAVSRLGTSNRSNTNQPPTVA